MIDNRDIVGPALTISVNAEDEGFIIEAQELLRQVTTFGSAGSGDSQFQSPQGIITTVDGSEVWVCDMGNDRIVMFTSEGAWVDSFGSSGSGNGQLADPKDIVIAGDYAYVADYTNNRIQKFDVATHSYQAQWSTGAASLPSGIAYCAATGYLYAALQGAQSVVIYDTLGNLISTISLSYAPNDVAVSPDGTKIYVTSASGCLRYTASGAYEGNLGVGLYNEAGEFLSSKYLHVDGLGHLYVADNATYRVYRQLSDGELLGTFVTEGTSSLQVSSFGGITRFQRYVYLVDASGARIIKCAPTGEGNGAVVRLDKYGNVQLTGVPIHATAI